MKKLMIITEWVVKVFPKKKKFPKRRLRKTNFRGQRKGIVPRGKLRGKLRNDFGRNQGKRKLVGRSK